MSTLTINPQIYHYAEVFAQRENRSIKEVVESILMKAFTKDSTLLSEDKSQAHSWKDYNVSNEVLSMTFSERKDIPLDYKGEYYRAINANE